MRSQKILPGFSFSGLQDIRKLTGVLKIGNLIYSVDNSIVENLTWLKNGDGLIRRFEGFLRNWRKRERSLRNYSMESGLLLRSLILIMSWVNFLYRGVQEFFLCKSVKSVQEFFKSVQEFFSKCPGVFPLLGCQKCPGVFFKVSRSILTFVSIYGKTPLRAKIKHLPRGRK